MSKDLKQIENEKLRYILWLRHGCSFEVLYGDDGEMCCNECQIDFKRDDISKIIETFENIGRKQYEEYEKKSKEFSQDE